MNKNILKSNKLKISQAKLGMDCSDELEIMIEITNELLFKRQMARYKLTLSELSFISDILPNPIVKTKITLLQLAEIIKWDCVVSIEEDSEIKAEDES